MHPLIKKILLEIIKESQSSLGRKPSQDNEHYLDKILMVLYSDIKWKYLEGPLYHDTYRKKFQYWANELNVFEKTHEIICTLLQDKFYNHNLLNSLTGYYKENLFSNKRYYYAAIVSLLCRNIGRAG